ncbi:MAG: VOC family protein [Desulfobacterales bacterium]|nr:MAG: VOC family protein [Desulfobacterales bacterium]
MSATRRSDVEFIHHVGILVSDLERSVRFYRDILGFEVLEKVDLVAGEEVSAGVGLPNTQLRLVHLGAGEGRTRIELLHYISPKSRPIPEGAQSNDIGVGHAAFQVSDIDRYYEDLKGRGVRFISPVQESSTGEKFCYFYDPDGAILEIIQPPEGKLRSLG